MSFKSYFFRVYGLLLGVTLAVVLVCWALFQGINQVRHQAWLDQLPAPLLHWIDAHPDQVQWLDARTENLEVDRRPLDSLDAVLRERLGYGQVVSRPVADGIHAYYGAGDGEAWVLRLRNPYRTLLEASGLLLAGVGDNLPDARHGERLPQYAALLGMRLVKVSEAAQIPDQAALEQLAERRFSFAEPRGGLGGQLFLRLDDGSIWRLQAPPPFQPWRWTVLLPLALLVAAALGVVVYGLMAGLHQRLRTIENVVARIARGELDARVRGDALSMAGRLGDSFNRMADHIQRLVQVQREMIHAVSHELRTPVARIRFGVQMIEGLEGKELREQLAGIDGDIQELDELIDEILTYARLEQGGPILAVQDTDVLKTVDQVVREQRTLRPDLAIDAESAPGSESYASADAEPRYLHRAIQNLVGNATRYARSRVRVHCQLSDETCRIDVEDDGPGIPEEEWEKVFTAFARLDDSRTRKSGGYGLGLSIVRRILYWHGGQAFVGRSEKLGGACFSLVWPRRQVH